MYTHTQTLRLYFLAAYGAPGIVSHEALQDKHGEDSHSCSIIANVLRHNLGYEY
jgi:hypothetical protein